jgi:hypothetical protein
LKSGKKSSLTGEKVLKLTEMDFVFDASERRGNCRNHSDNGINDGASSSLNMTITSPYHTGMQQAQLSAATNAAGVVAASSSSNDLGNHGHVQNFVHNNLGECLKFDA